MSSPNIADDLIGEEIQMWTQKLNDKNRYLSELQEERQKLQTRRSILEQTVGRQIGVVEYFTNRPDIDNIDNREIYELVNEIHNLELRSLELDEKLRIVEIEKEVKDIIRSFQPVKEDASHLSSWFRELKCQQQGQMKGDCVVDFIIYSSEKHNLKFTVVYKGVALMMDITESMDNGSSKPVYRVRSDIFIEDLAENVSEVLQNKRPVEDLLTLVKAGMEEDILPFIACDAVSKDEEVDEKMETLKVQDTRDTVDASGVPESNQQVTLDGQDTNISEGQDTKDSKCVISEGQSSVTDMTQHEI